ncbi:glyoxalase/bleomycin resistance/extradiol dioxygenase family protein [Nocardiopsis sp. FIRDI 009]|uniref:VOC family protein n=1 Tax=Nocardiopsis sp. FIRDI 009 TaxID=714197 RepID=UPI000E25493A|nr:hypothetical protein [Nocardiopsis sp. FIRDI 009]
MDLDSATTPGLGVALWLKCDDAPALHDALVAAGVRVARPVAPSPSGPHLAFVDPEGYVVTVHGG